MPLCPQITNTPITVTQTADFTVTSVVPLIADTSDGLAGNLESIEILADGKTKVYRQASPPTVAGINDGDLWIDTDDGNKLYVRVSGAWVSAQDASIGVAQTTANNAAIAAGAAQSTATTALANAATAYNAAVASLQPSANTIVNASNQITAINGTGITVYSGASATTGPRVVLNSLGLAAYGSGSSFNVTNAVGNGSTVTYTASGHTFPVGRSITVSGLAPEGYNGTFVITAVAAGSTFTVANTTTATLTDSNGVAESATLAISATTGNAVFSGSVTGSTIIGGTLNIAGNAIIDGAGLLTATGATITGTINATAGYFGTSTNGFSISSTGLVGVGTGTIVGGTIQGATFNNGSGTFFVSSAGVVTAISGTIGGWSLTSTAISKTVGTKTMTLDSSNAILTITDSSSGILSGGGINITSAGTTGSYGAGALSYGGLVSVQLASGNLLLQGGATSAIRLTPGAGLGSTTYNVQVEGHLNNPAYTLTTGTYSASSTDLSTGTYLSATGAMIARRDNQIPIFSHRYNAAGTTEMIRLNYNGVDAGGITTTSGGVPAFRNASDYRLKKDIQDFIGAADIIKAIQLRSFKYNIEPDKTAVGFIAHELQQVLPDLVLGEKDAIDEEGNPAYQSITATNLIPYLTGALKDVIVRLELLEQGR